MNVMNLIFEEENTSSILEKYVKDIIYENYTDEILMAERGRLFGFEADEDYFSAVNICFRKKYIPSIIFLNNPHPDYFPDTAPAFLLPSPPPVIRSPSPDGSWDILGLNRCPAGSAVRFGIKNGLLSFPVPKVEDKGIVCGVGPEKKA